MGAVQNLHLYQGPQGGDLYFQSHTPTTLLILLPCNIITAPAELLLAACFPPTTTTTTNNNTTTQQIDSCSRITLDNPLDHSPNHNKTPPLPPNNFSRPLAAFIHQLDFPSPLEVTFTFNTPSSSPLSPAPKHSLVAARILSPLLPPHAYSPSPRLAY